MGGARRSQVGEILAKREASIDEATVVGREAFSLLTGRPRRCRRTARAANGGLQASNKPHGGPWLSHTPEKGVLYAMSHSKVLLVTEGAAIVARRRLATKQAWARY